MHLFPQRLKYNKIHRKKLKKLNSIISYTKYQKHNLQIISTVSGTLTTKQLASLRHILLKKLKNNSALLLNVFTDLPLTAKPTATRMGKGKGNLKHWICKFKAGAVLFILRSINLQKTIMVLKKGINKLPLKIQLKTYKNYA